MGYLLDNYIVNHPGTVGQLLVEHLTMTSVALAIAVLIALPLSLLIAQVRWLSVPVLGFLGGLYTIPSLALLIFLIPLFGLNARSVIVAIVLYAQVILVRSLLVGLQSISPAVMEAARGMGMNGWQRLWQVQVPLLLPIFLVGLRISAIVAVAIATVGAKVGAGGLGRLLFDGVAQTRDDKILAGAILVSILAFGFNGAILALERAANPARRYVQAPRWPNLSHHSGLS